MSIAVYVFFQQINQHIFLFTNISDPVWAQIYNMIFTVMYRDRLM